MLEELGYFANVTDHRPAPYRPQSTKRARPRFAFGMARKEEHF